MRSPVGRIPIFWLSALGALFLTGAGCSLGQSGINPPVDQIFLPSGLAVDPDGNWLYVINSNNDLRFNAGTLLALDLQKAKRDRDNPAPWAECNTTHFTDDNAPETLAGTLELRGVGRRPLAENRHRPLQTLARHPRPHAD